MLEIRVHHAILGRRAHHGPTLDMRGLILDNVIFAVHGVRLVELDSHGLRDLHLDFGGINSLAVFMFGPIESESKQRIPHLVGVLRIQVHEIVAIRQVLSGESNS